MKLTEEQKQSICAVYERALTMKEKYGKKPLLITFEIDHYQNFEVRLYNDEHGNLTRLAGDIANVYETDHCLRTINELEEYCVTFLNNKEASKRMRIAALEDELAKLKED